MTLPGAMPRARMPAIRATTDHARRPIQLNGGQIAGIAEPGFANDAEIVVDRDGGVEDRDNHQGQVALAQGRGEQRQLTHEADERRNARQSKHADRQGQGQQWRPLVQAGQLLDGDVAAVAVKPCRSR